MGIIVFMVALLSQLGVGANRIFRAEIPGSQPKFCPGSVRQPRFLITYLVLTLWKQVYCGCWGCLYLMLSAILWYCSYRWSYHKEWEHWRLSHRIHPMGNHFIYVFVRC